MEENKEVVEETTQQPVEETVENTETTETTESQEQESPVSINEEGDYKIDMSKVKELEDANQEQETTDVPADQPTETVQEVVEEVPSEQAPVQNEESGVSEQTEEVAEEVTEEYVDLPENIQKLMDFMEDTGGD